MKGLVTEDGQVKGTNREWWGTPGRIVAGSLCYFQARCRQRAGGRSLEPASAIVLEEEAPPGAAAGCRQDQNRKKTGGLGWWMISIPISLSFHLIISCRCLPLGSANRKLGGRKIYVRQIRVQLPGAWARRGRDVGTWGVSTRDLCYPPRRSAQHPGLLGSPSSLPGFFVLLTTLKERRGSACTPALSHIRHFPFLCAWKWHKRLCTEA